MNVAHQRPMDLLLGVTRRELPLEWTILKTATVQIDQWGFVFHIVGESHRVRMMHHDNGLYLQEILACVELQPEDCLAYHAFHQLSAYNFQQDRYRIAVSFSDKPEGLQETGLEVVFPKINGQAPITQIKWQQKDAIFRWWTYHLYPEHDRQVGVYTTSEFKLD